MLSITLKIVQQDNGKIVDTLIENNLPTPNLLDDVTEKPNSNKVTKKLKTEFEVKNKIKEIVTKRVLPKLPQNTHVYSKPNNTSKFADKQKKLKKDLQEISKILLKRFSLSTHKARKRYRNRKSKNQIQLPTQKNLSSVDEWQRQKQQNLVYFNFRPKLGDELDPKKSDEHITEYINKKRKKPKNIDSINKSDASVTSNDSSNSESSNASSENNQKVNKEIKRKHSVTESDILNKIPKVELNENKIRTETKSNNIIEISDDSDNEVITINPSASSNNSNNENVIQNTSDSYNSEINTNECGNYVNEQKNSELISLLSKVAGKIQENNMITAGSPQNSSSVFALAPTSQNFYVVRLPNNSFIGSNTTVISPLPDLPGPMPIIQSVSSLNQLSTDQITYPNQTLPNPNQIFLNQIPSNLPNSTNTNWSNAFENLVKVPSAMNESHIVTPVPLRTTPMPLIQTVSSLRQMDQENFQNRPFDTCNQSQIADSSINNLQRRNSEVLPITAVTSRPVREDLGNQTTSKVLDNTIYPIVVSSGPPRSKSVETERNNLYKSDATESLNVFETLKYITKQVTVLKNS
ncbi:unnamed protein product [Euphydryas editha]|uniref:Uncharacterized protein n=1 Tax=Euphydryas editha TaxID=104508 RepID=A0AAU9TAA0_EUPED|nr:unnamed protein product [Euphydryas editha]